MRSRVVADTHRPVLIIDCAEMARAKTDGALVTGLSEQTGKLGVVFCERKC